jgi:peptidoglycan hydrolase-like protein with peptidoglycan-binding domain
LPTETAAADSGGGSRRLAFRAAGGLVVIVALVAGLWAAGTLRGRPTVTGPGPAAATGSVAVARTDIAERQQVAGNLGYAGSLTVVGYRSGTVTALPQPGKVVEPGGEVAEIDGSPVLLMLGQRPAWRTFVAGMAPGPDVRQLEAGLRALGFDPGNTVSVDNRFSAATSAAVRRWQRALHVPQTGTVPMGSVVFLPRPIRVTHDEVLPGAPVAPGQPLITGTTTDHEVTVALDTARQGLVHVGDRVVVTLPDGLTTAEGTVTFVSRVATAGDSNSGNGTGGAPPTVQVTVALARQSVAGRLDQAPVQVSITDQLHRSVLAVPVTALLAVPGGGYAVTKVDGTTVQVRVGLFDDLSQLIEVSGPGLQVGMLVQVPKA